MNLPIYKILENFNKSKINKKEIVYLYNFTTLLILIDPPIIITIAIMPGPNRIGNVGTPNLRELQFIINMCPTSGANWRVAVHRFLADPRLDTLFVERVLTWKRYHVLCFISRDTNIALRTKLGIFFVKLFEFGSHDNPWSI
jgi:hypothetical protein